VSATLKTDKIERALTIFFAILVAISVNKSKFLIDMMGYL